jgi:hypothetical protein
LCRLHFQGCQELARLCELQDIIWLEELHLAVVADGLQLLVQYSSPTLWIYTRHCQQMVINQVTQHNGALLGFGLWPVISCTTAKTLGR